MASRAAVDHRATGAGTWASSGPRAGVAGSRKRSDVEEANSGGADVEVIVVELGFYDHVTAETYKHESLVSNPAAVAVWEKEGGD